MTSEGSHGADEDLVALKRKMGILPPEEPRADAPAMQARVEAGGKNEEAELAAALEELDAEARSRREKEKAER